MCTHRRRESKGAKGTADGAATPPILAPEAYIALSAFDMTEHMTKRSWSYDRSGARRLNEFTAKRERERELCGCVSPPKPTPPSCLFQTLVLCYEDVALPSERSEDAELEIASNLLLENSRLLFSFK